MKLNPQIMDLLACWETPHYLGYMTLLIPRYDRESTAYPDAALVNTWIT
jgi:hypothetical protein